MRDIETRLIQLAGEENFRRNESMKEHTSFRAGGAARYFVTPATREALINVVSYLSSNALPYFILGNGTNLLVSDKGYKGTVVNISKEFSKITIEDNIISAQAGVLLSKIASSARDAGLAGFEFASGIPGTLGGACVMNAGAYGGEMKDVLLSVEVLTEKGEAVTFDVNELCLGYRTSIIKQKGYTVLGAKIKLTPGEPEKIQSLMDDFASRRREKQPLNFPSAGSTFKRPEGYFAGKLISDAGLKGFRIGGASVSKKHAGFVVNDKVASAEDIFAVIKHVQREVYERFGVELEPEVKFLGEFE